MTDRGRRSFLGKSLTGAGGLGLGGSVAHAAPHTGRSSLERINVGVVSAGVNSHMNADLKRSIWAPMINREAQPDIWPIGRTTNMQITHVWDSRPEVSREFARNFNCEAVKRYDDMVGRVDGMIFAGFNEVPWWPQLTRPYLEAGMPCFINRPFAYSMKDAHDIIDTARRHNAPILCTDEREFIREAHAARSRIKHYVGGGIRVKGVNSDNSAGNEYPQHGVHGLYYLLAVLGLDVEKVSLQADGWWREVTSSAHVAMQCGLLTLYYRGIELKSGKRQDTPFIAAQQQLSRYGAWAAGMRIYHDGGWWDVDSTIYGGPRWERFFHLFFPTVLAMQQLFETREMQWSYDYILRKTRIFLAGFKSHLEHEGGFVTVDDLPDDWRAPNPYPDWINPSIFD